MNNEILHGTWYEKKLENPDVTEEMFKMVHAHNPDAKLFLNEYDIVARGIHTTVSLIMYLNYFV